MRVAGLALAALIVAVWAASCSVITSPRPKYNPGGLTHYEANNEEFDYPSEWRLIAGPTDVNGKPDTDLMEWVLAVVGTGSWHRNCVAAGCGPDTFDVSGGKIVVKVYQAHQIGPISLCDGAEANATFGSVAVRQSGSPTDRIWEIREPGAPYFGAVNDLWVEARTDDPEQMAQAEALVATIHWSNDGGIAGPDCLSPDPPAAAS